MTDTRDHRDDDGFTVVEVVVAVVLLAAVIVSAGGFLLSGVVATAGLQRRDTAAQVADEAMDLVRAVPATTATGGVVALVEGRAQADVEAHWASAPAALTAVTDPVWDDSVTGDPVVPLTVTRAAGGIDYTVDTYIGTCRIAPGDSACTTAATGVENYRVVVRVTWDEGAARCDDGGCEYTLATLVNGDDEPVFNPDAEAAAPVAVDDTLAAFVGAGAEVDLLANDTGTLGDTPVVIQTPPQHGTLSGDIARGRVTYTTTDPTVTSDSFTYSLTGLIGDVSNVAVVTVTVSAGSVADDTATTTYPDAATVDVRANDTGAYRTGTVTVGPPLSGATASVAGNQLVVTPASPFAGGVVGAPTGSNLVTNGGFENAPGRVTNASTTLASLPGWTRSGGSGAPFEVLHGIGGGAPEGGNYVELDTTRNITMSQSISTTPGTRYRLTFRYTPYPDEEEDTNQLRVQWGGATVADLAHDADDLGPWWTTYTYEVVASGSSTTLAFTGRGTSDGRGVRLDDVRLFALTPESAALSTTPWTVTAGYVNTTAAGTASGTARVTVSPPPAVDATNLTVCVPRGQNSRVTFSLASGIASGVTTGAVFARTSTPSTSLFSTPQGPLSGDAAGTVTVETVGEPSTGAGSSFTWSVRDAWGRTDTAQVALQVRSSC